MNIDLGGCARCGGDHIGLEFKEFVRPIIDDEGTWTHWAPCPMNGDPIIWKMDRKRHHCTCEPTWDEEYSVWEHAEDCKDGEFMTPEEMAVVP